MDRARPLGKIPAMPKQSTTSTAQEPPAHTLSSMAEALGPPDSDLEGALLEGATDIALVRVGRTIASSHLIVDATRLYSTAFDVWQQATKEQKETLRGFSGDLLAIGVARAQRLSDMLDAHEARESAVGAARGARDAAARVAFTAGLTARDQAAKVLRGVAGQDAALVSTISAAIGTAETGAALVKGLRALAATGKKMLEQKKGPVAKRAKLMRVDDAYVASIEAAAARVNDTAVQAGAKTTGKAVTQGALDREDGVNALILKHIIDVFEVAHDIDPTIPRLVPLATRRLFNRYRKTTKPGEEGEDTPVEEVEEEASDEDAVDAEADEEVEEEEVAAPKKPSGSAASKKSSDAETAKAPAAGASAKAKTSAAKPKAKAPAK